MARPRLPEDKRHSVRFDLHVTPVVAQRIYNISDLLGLSYHDVIRGLVTAGLVAVEPKIKSVVDELGGFFASGHDIMNMLGDTEDVLERN